MAKRLLTACVAALGLAACQREPSPTASRSPLRPSTVSPTRAPKEVSAPAPEREAAVVVDGGTTEPEESGLGLAHDHHGRVDHLLRARRLREEGDLSGALTEYRRAVHDMPWDEEVLRPLAETARSTSQHALAAGAFERLARVRPTDAVPLVQQARTLLAMNDSPSALRVAAEALARDTENPEVYQVLGRCHLVQGDLSLAITRLERAVELAPEHGHALNNLGFAYLRANENTRAVEVLERATALLPQVAHVQNNLGVALERTGQTSRARDAFALATSLSPRYVKARVNSERMRQLASAAPLPSPRDSAVGEELADEPRAVSRLPVEDVGDVGVDVGGVTGDMDDVMPDSSEEPPAVPEDLLPAVEEAGPSAQ